MGKKSHCSLRSNTSVMINCMCNQMDIPFGVPFNAQNIEELYMAYIRNIHSCVLLLFT